MKRTYLCIDLKSFYASVECVQRGLDPMTANLVVADPSRTDRTICLAVSPSLKKAGVKNRCRLFEIPKSLEYITAVPRMRLYLEASADIYELYLKYISAADIHVYSIDEAFLDVTEYLPFYNKTPHEMAALLQNEIYSSLGLTASCGIGTNMYLSKIALDIMAKRSPCLTAYLDEEQFRRLLWDHRPISDFWMIASGTSSRLRKIGITCMEQLAKSPPELIMKQFGVNGKELIEHAWGRDDTTISAVRNYVPKQRSVSHSQVIGTGCSKERGLILLREMTDELCLCLTDCGRKARSLSVYTGYSRALGAPERVNTSRRISPENRYSVIRDYTDRIYNERVPANINVHRIGVTLGDLQPAENEPCLLEDAPADKERALQQTVCLIKKQYGKGSILKGSSYLPEATGRERNGQIGGHRA